MTRSERIPPSRDPFSPVTHTPQTPVGSADAAGESELLADSPILQELLQLDPEKVPPEMAGLLAMISQPAETHELLGQEPIPLGVVKSIVSELMTRRQSEREVFLSAIDAYRDLTERITLELADARSELSAQGTAAQLERAQLLKEFLDRLDVLTAKISTSAARYERELEDKDRLFEDQQQHVLAYASRAADAQSVIDDIHRSSSWRLTAPLRLMSRLAARRSSASES
jgi:hypothetical protein